MQRWNEKSGGRCCGSASHDATETADLGVRYANVCTNEVCRPVSHIAILFGNNASDERVSVTHFVQRKLEFRIRAIRIRHQLFAEFARRYRQRMTETGDSAGYEMYRSAACQRRPAIRTDVRITPDASPCVAAEGKDKTDHSTAGHFRLSGPAAINRKSSNDQRSQAFPTEVLRQ